MKGFFGKTEGRGNRAIYFLKGLAAGYALTAIVFMVLAIALTYTDMSEGLIPLISSVTTAVSCLLGGIISGRGIKSRGLLCGVISAVFYILVMLLIGIFAKSGESLGIASIPVIIMALGAGALGGILGVNS